MDHPVMIPVLLAGCLVVCLIPGPGLCNPSHKTSTCQVHGDRADCSHLNLKEIPSNLPSNITSLDMSHNRLVRLPADTLVHYPGLLHLDVGYNSLTRLEEGVCQTLALLRSLNVQKNEVHLLTEKDLIHCSTLTELNLASNRLKLQGEPFSALENLKVLNVSRNNLMLAKLGSHPQLPTLESLSLAYNLISTLRHDDFIYFRNSSSLRALDLSGLPLKKTEAGVFKPIAGIQELTMDGSKLNTQVSKLCTELSGTAIRHLSLQKVLLVTVTNITFQGLGKTNLTSLDLSYNSISKIGGEAFKWLPMLEVLSLENNNLKHLTKDTFKGLRGLTLLNLRSALVKSHTANPVIDNFSFQPLGALESLILEHTTFNEITEHTFAGLTSLRYLQLGWCKCLSLKTITNQTFMSLAESPLHTLNLTATAIIKLCPGAFARMPNLTTLLLGWNFIKQVLTGNEFQGLNQVQEIYLSNNRQAITLTPMSFAHVPNLRSLMLGRSLTGTLDLQPSPFRPLTNLTFLDLSNNNIANINAGLLEGLEHLKVLKLQHNNLARVWKSANPGGPVLFLRGLSSLVALDMDYTGLDEIPGEALRGLTNLSYLSLNGNILNRLKDSVFDDLGSLRVLMLQKNLITSVTQKVFGSALANLKQLVMDHNPYDCTCDSILWFVEWLNGTNGTVHGLGDEYMCNTPLLYYNRTIMEFDPLSCKDMTPFLALYILTSSAVLTLMVIALLVHFQGWRIQFYWNILINRTLGLSEANSVEGRAFVYDAYVIHAAKDRGWVERSLLPLENERYEFFLEDRDAVPGESRLEAIVDNMRRSRKIIFVITESLLRDPWCRQFKAHHALHQVMEDNRDSVVLVFLQDIEDYRLSQSLLLRRGMLRRHCVLDWPLQRERIPAFRQRLRVALGTTNRVQ